MLTIILPLNVVEVVSHKTIDRRWPARPMESSSMRSAVGYRVGWACDTNSVLPPPFRSGQMFTMSAYTVTLLAALAVLLPYAAPQAAVGNCTDVSMLREFFNKLPQLPDGYSSCTEAVTTFAQPAAGSLEDLSDDITSTCTVECGESYAAFLYESCDSRPLASSYVPLCMPTNLDAPRSRCRAFAPDFLEDMLIDNLQACMDFEGNCSSDCEMAIASFFNATSCCYQILYASTMTIDEFVDRSFITETQATYLRNIYRTLGLLSECGTPMPPPCAGDPFPAATPGNVLGFGFCTRQEIRNYVEENLSDDCLENYDAIFTTEQRDQTQLEEALDGHCTRDCGQRIVEFELNTCLAAQTYFFERGRCYEIAEPLVGERVGERCALAVGQHERVRPLFGAVAADCFVFDPTSQDCPRACNEALTALADQVGCCYQYFYNNTELANLYLIEKQLTLSERPFLDFVRNPVLWDACAVPLVETCEGSPFAEGGAVKFAASSVIVLLFGIFVALF